MLKRVNITSLSLTRLVKNMNIKQAKEYFNLGLIYSFDVVRAPMSGVSWNISISGKMGVLSVETALHSVKNYSCVDSALRDIERIAGRVSSLSVKP